MAYFQSKEHLYEVLGGFFKHLSEDANIGPKLKDSKLKLQFHYKDFAANIAIDLSGEDIQILTDASDFKPDVEMFMKSETAHKFWQGKVNLVVALARREITAKGPIPKILKLLPIIKPAYKIYPEFLNDQSQK